MGRLLDEDVVIKEIASWREACKDTSHFETASDLMLVIKSIKDLPSVQPDIIYCCECLSYGKSLSGKYLCLKHCTYPQPNHYCADAERRTDDQRRSD